MLALIANTVAVSVMAGIVTSSRMIDNFRASVILFPEAGNFLGKLATFFFIMVFC
jgi:hypothetical protein